MKEKTDKILTLVLLGVSLITAVFAVIFALQSDSKHVMDGIRELGNNFSGMFDVAFWILVILLAIAICAIVELVGARFSGQASFSTPTLRKQVEYFANSESG